MQMQNKTRRKIVWGTTFIVLVFAVFAIYYWQRYQIDKKNIDQKNYFESLIDDNPDALQKAFVEDVRENDKSSLSQSDAYFVTHRYFDNGGDVYEVFDYVERHPELDFLKEAERIYPNAFKNVREHISSPGSRSHKYAYLAYMEVLDKHGYAGPQTWATVANVYIREAWIGAKHPEQLQYESNLDLEKFVKFRKDKAIPFAEKARDSVAQVMRDGTLGNAPSRDIVVMLNQYASALRYFESLGIVFDSPYTADEIFVFSTDYAKQNAHEFYLWTAYLNVTLMNTLTPHRKIGMEQALEPLLAKKVDDIEKVTSRPGVTGKIIKARSQQLSYFPNTTILENSYDAYDKSTIVELSKNIPRFRDWLLTIGWTENDFKGWE